MNQITWIEQYYDYILSLIPKDTESVLDIGAGSGIFGYILTKTRSIKRLDAIEPFAYDSSYPFSKTAQIPIIFFFGKGRRVNFFLAI